MSCREYFWPGIQGMAVPDLNCFALASYLSRLLPGCTKIEGEPGLMKPGGLSPLLAACSLAKAR